MMNSFEQKNLSHLELINTSVLVSSDILLERERERDAGVHIYHARAHNLLINQIVSKPANFILSKNNSVNAEIFERRHCTLRVFQHLKYIPICAATVNPVVAAMPYSKNYNPVYKSNNNSNK